MKNTPLWTCPKCGVKLLTRNLAHSCGRATLGDWRRRMGPRGRALFDGFARLIGRCGRYDISPAKTRITFLARVRFAGVTAVSEAGMTCSFAMPYPLGSRRFVKVEEVAPGWWVHRLRVDDPRQFDAELQRWLRVSYRLMGMRGRFGRSRISTAGRRARGRRLSDGRK
jgi:hypothetical protein